MGSLTRLSDYKPCLAVQRINSRLLKGRKGVQKHLMKLGATGINSRGCILNLANIRKTHKKFSVPSLEYVQVPIQFSLSSNDNYCLE